MLIKRQTQNNKTKFKKQIDRDSYVPVYVQLANLLSQEIASGELTAGEQLPSEAGICKLYDVSPMTVRRAISLLVDQGIVSTQRGKGTFVKRLDLGTATFKFNGLQELFDSAASVEIKILGARLDSADKVIAKKLGLPVGEKIIHLRRLLIMDDEPFFYQNEYLVCDVTKPVVEAEMEVTSMRGFFEGSGNNLFKRGELQVRSGLMNQEEAKYLQVSMPAAAMYLTHIFFDYSDKPMSYGHVVCRSDSVSFDAIVGINVKK